MCPSLLIAVIVTVPVLEVAFAAKVNVRFGLSSMRLFSARNSTIACADTSTVKGVGDAGDTVAVTVADPPFSAIDSCDR